MDAASTSILDAWGGPWRPVVKVAIECCPSLHSGPQGAGLRATLGRPVVRPWIGELARSPVGSEGWISTLAGSACWRGQTDQPSAATPRDSSVANDRSRSSGRRGD